MGLLGFLGKKKAVTYKRVNKEGKATYIGVTNNPKKRAAQHNASGKSSGSLVVTSKPLPRRTALKQETRNLKSYKKAVGRRPSDNKTDNGKFVRRRKSSSW